MHADIERVLLSEERIQTALGEVAAEVSACYRERDFTAVCVLKGSFIFASDLIRRIPSPLELAFVSASSYGSGDRPGRLELAFLPCDGDFGERDVLLLDDILDTGRTLATLREELLARGARSVRTCVFLDKPARREVDFRPDFRCFEIEDRFVVGYGLDFAGRYRNLPYVGVLRAEVLSERRPGEHAAG